METKTRTFFFLFFFKSHQEAFRKSIAFYLGKQCIVYSNYLGK